MVRGGGSGRENPVTPRTDVYISIENCQARSFSDIENQIEFSSTFAPYTV